MSDLRGEIVGVHLGTGGSPLILGLPAFAVGSVALGMGLIGKPTSFEVVAPIVLFSTGLYLLVTTGWAIILGQSIVACIFGLFSGFWLSLGALVIGLHHAWFGIPAANIAAAEQLFFISYACLFFFLVIPCLRLPLIYPAIIVLVVAALALAAAGLYVIAGYVVLAFDFLGFWAFLNVSLTAMGFARVPPIGRVLA